MSSIFLSSSTMIQEKSLILLLIILFWSLSSSYAYHNKICIFLKLTSAWITSDKEWIYNGMKVTNNIFFYNFRVIFHALFMLISIIVPYTLKFHFIWLTKNLLIFNFLNCSHPQFCFADCFCVFLLHHFYMQ